MYTVVTNNKREEFKNKEELIGYFVSRENLFGAVPETYVPSVFREVAMNPNDRRTVANFHGEYLPLYFGAEKVLRTVMVYDGDNRVVDIRAWLPEFRAAMKEKINSTSKTVWFGCGDTKPRFRDAYRVGKGQKQRKCLHEQIDREELDEVMSSVPANLLRRWKQENNEDWAPRGNCRSWKKQSKCRKSWQRRSGQPSARKLHEADWQNEVNAIEKALMAEIQKDMLLQAG